MILSKLDSLGFFNDKNRENAVFRRQGVQVFSPASNK